MLSTVNPAATRGAEGPGVGPRPPTHTRTKFDTIPAVSGDYQVQTSSERLNSPGAQVNARVLRTSSEPQARLGGYSAHRVHRPSAEGREREGQGRRVGIAWEEGRLSGGLAKVPSPKGALFSHFLPHEFLNIHFCKIIFTPSPMPLTAPFLD